VIDAGLRAVLRFAGRFALGALVVGGAACGYSFSGTSLPTHIKTIAIPMFQNESLDATIASEATRGITESFVADSRLKLAREGNADCVLEGKVVGYERNVYSYSAGEVPEAYIIVVRVAVILKDRVKNRDLWSDEGLTATATFPAVSGETVSEGTSGGEGPPQNEEDARAAAIRNLAQDILARTLEQW
jgi:hypothetical protein